MRNKFLQKKQSFNIQNSMEKYLRTLSIHKRFGAWIESKPLHSFNLYRFKGYNQYYTRLWSTHSKSFNSHPTVFPQCSSERRYQDGRNVLRRLLVSKSFNDHMKLRSNDNIFMVIKRSSIFNFYLSSLLHTIAPFLCYICK